MSYTKIAAAKRKEQIILIAVQLAAKSTDYTKITRHDIASVGNFSVNLITHYFTMAKLQREIIRRALREEIVEILAQGLVRRDKRVMKMPEPLKSKVATYLTR